MFLRRFLICININKSLSAWSVKSRLFSVVPKQESRKLHFGGRFNMSTNDDLFLSVVASSVKIADRAGIIIRDVMSGGNLKIVDKGINDFQTEADRRAQRCILASLQKKFPSVTVIGEEEETSDNADWVELGQCDEVMSQAVNLPQELKTVDAKDICIWVDPLDGTNEYTQGYLDHVTILIGVAVKGRAVAGVIHQPYYNNQSADIGRTIWGIVGLGAFGLERHTPPKNCRKILTTRSHETELVRKTAEACQPTDIIRIGGAGFKVLYLIEGKAHAYLFANSGCKKWDTCAPEAILKAVGGHLTDIHGSDMSYHPDVKHPNDGGIAATAYGEDHDWYISMIPQEVKDVLKSQ